MCPIETDNNYIVNWNHVDDIVNSGPERRVMNAQRGQRIDRSIGLCYLTSLGKGKFAGRLQCWLAGGHTSSVC